MAAKDGNLYELVYQADDGWFTRKCRKTNLTYNPLSNFVPSFLFSSEGKPRFHSCFSVFLSFLSQPQIDTLLFSSKDPLFLIQFDETRNFLYTLSEKNVIQVGSSPSFPHPFTQTI